MQALKKLLAFVAVASLPLGAMAEAPAIKFKFSGDLNNRFMVFTDQAQAYRGAETLSTGTGPNLTEDTNEEMWGEIKYRFQFEGATEDGMARAVYNIELGAIRYGNGARGGSYSGDGNNYETRLAYLDLGLPTASKNRLTLGLQVFTVNKYLWNETAMGVQLKGDAGPAKYTLAWMRGDDVFTSSTRQEIFADGDNYLVRADFSPMKDAKAGAFVLYQHRNPETGTGTASYQLKRFGAGVTYDIFNVGVDAAYKFGDIFVNADLIYQNGKVVEPGAAALDLSAFFAHLDVGVNLGAAKVTYTGWYASGDDDGADDKLKNFISTDVDIFDSVVLFEGGYTDDNYITEAPYFGTAGAIFNKLAVDYKAAPAVTVGGAIMYVMTAEDVPVGPGTDTSKAIGTELDAYVSYKINPNTEIALNAGYLISGDVIDNFETGPNAGDGKADVNIFRSTARVRYQF